MYAIVCGGRDFNEDEIFRLIMDYFVLKYNITTIVEGGQKGADFLAEVYAKSMELNHIQEKANWKKYKKAAGPIRNRKMLDNYSIELVIGFKGNIGTTDMLNYTKSKNIPCFRLTNKNILINWLTNEPIGDINDIEIKVAELENA